MMWGYYSGTAGMGWWMILSSLFWLGLVAVAVWALVRYVSYRTRLDASRNTDRLADTTSAEDILRQRYARGEIDDETFQRMRAQLERQTDRSPALPGGSR